MLHDSGNIWAVVLAAGSGTRLADAVGGQRKQYLDYNGFPLFFNSVFTLSRIPALSGVVIVFPPEDVDAMRDEVKRIFNEQGLGLPWRVAAGGERRQDSVRNALQVLPDECGCVLVHDGARPFVSPQLITSLLDTFSDGQKQAQPAGGVIPALALKDTVKIVDNSGMVSATPDRSTLRLVQTPQVFSTPLLVQAHAAAVEKGWDVTDDASVMEAFGRECTSAEDAELYRIFTVAGEEANVKVTTADDLCLLQPVSQTVIPVVGSGYDVHRYGTGRPMVLGGVPIQGGPEVVAHSDGDVLLHALMDGILGCMAKGDIGQHFPDSDPAYENISSSVLLKEVLMEAEASGLEIVHVDMTVVAQVPKLAPWRAQIVRNVSRLLGLGEHQVNFKATTEEKLGFTGQKAGLKAHAVVTAVRRG